MLISELIKKLEERTQENGDTSIGAILDCRENGAFEAFVNCSKERAEELKKESRGTWPFSEWLQRNYPELIIEIETYCLWD